jgi:peptidyl-prolyl cis-trans isomerase C
VEFFAALLIGASLLLQAESAPVNPDDIVVTVNDAAVFQQQVLEEVDNRINANSAREAAHGLTLDESSREIARDQMRAEAIHALIERVLIAQQLATDGIEITDADVDAHFLDMAAARGQTPEEAEQQFVAQGRTFRAVKERIRWNTLGVERLYNLHATDKKVFTEGDARRLYDEYPAEFDQPERRRVSHILIRVAADASDADREAARARAQAIVERINAGEDFAELAAAHSEDEATKARGGDRGYSTRGVVMGPDSDPFGNVAFAMTTIGATSDVVATPDGYHIIQLTALEPARRLAFEEVKQVLIDDFRHREIGAFWAEFGGQLRAAARIEWTPAEEARRAAAEARQREFNAEVERLIAREQPHVVDQAEETSEGAPAPEALSR